MAPRRFVRRRVYRGDNWVSEPLKQDIIDGNVGARPTGHGGALNIGAGR